MTVDSNNLTSILIDLTTINSSNVDESGNSLYETPYVQDVDGDDWTLHILSGPANGTISDTTSPSSQS